MATKTAGTKLTTSLTALQWQFGGLSAADIATINELIRNPTTGAYGNVVGLNQSAYIENGYLFLPNHKAPQGIRIDPSDWIMVDGAGWPIIVPNSIFATSWQHS